MVVTISDITQLLDDYKNEVNSTLDVYNYVWDFTKRFGFYVFCTVLPFFVVFEIRLMQYAAYYETIHHSDIMNSLVQQTINFNQSAYSDFNDSRFCEYQSVVDTNLLYYTKENTKQIFNAHEIRLGGEYYPSDCRPLYSSAILVAYRNRPEQLQRFIIYIHNYLRNQRIHCRIFIIEQANENSFNRGKLLNIGAQIALEHGFPCLILHDVDMMPERLGNIYACTNMPRHMASGINKFRYNLPYLSYFGAVTSVDSVTYKLINGFSNIFEGWGGEDDDFRNRLVYYGKNISRFQIEWSQYRMLVHQQEKPNPDRSILLSAGACRFKIDGINNLMHTFRNQSLNKFSTHIYVNT